MIIAAASYEPLATSLMEWSFIFEKVKIPWQTEQSPAPARVKANRLLLAACSLQLVARSSYQFCLYDIISVCTVHTAKAKK